MLYQYKSTNTDAVAPTRSAQVAHSDAPSASASASYSQYSAAFCSVDKVRCLLKLLVYGALSYSSMCMRP